MSEITLDSLTDSGHNPVILEVNYGMGENDKGLRPTNRSMGGVQRGWQWPTHKEFALPLSYVNSADAGRINQWWRDGDQLALCLNTSLDASTVIGRLSNSQQPLGELHQPYRQQWNGALLFKAVDAGSFQPQPFTIEDDVFGLLDQSYNGLVR